MSIAQKKSTVMLEDISQTQRLMRLTWNENNWEYPSGHKWHIKYQGTTEAHERQYGFGHEEWLFNSRYRINGFQYGFIRGVNQMSSEKVSISRLLLFTIDSKTKNRYLVGCLNNVEIIEGYEPEQKVIRPIIAQHLNDMCEELEIVSAATNHFKTTGYVANVKFEWHQVDIFNTPVLFNQIKGRRFNRFQPYKIDAKLTALINSKLDTKSKFYFESGKAANTHGYKKSASAMEMVVQRRHTAITNDLYAFHTNHLGLLPAQISCEKTRVGGQIVDFAIDENNVFTLFEVKTESAAVRNIRLALGQLIEYALLDQSARINKLVIVGPAEPNMQEHQYFKAIQSIIHIKLEYWSYSPTEKLLDKRFKITT